MKQWVPSAGWLASVTLAACIVAPGAPAAAQSSTTLRAIQSYGQTDRRTAQDIAQRVHARLIANARSGGAAYDPIRQVVGTAMFGGPGSNRAEYDRRLTQVVARLSGGLTDENLQALFSPGDGVSLRCARLFELPMASCDALVAAASQIRVDFPYIAPDDGDAVRAELTRSGVSRAHAAEIAQAMTTVLLAVPNAADGSPRGQRISRLLRSCPGSLPDEESRVRAWHLGATTGMVRCVAQAIGHDGRSAPAVLQQVFGLGAAGVALLQWAHGQSVRAPAAAPPPRSAGPSRNQLMAQATQLYQARRYADAARIYQQVTVQEPAFSAAHQGLAVSRMRAGDPAGAAAAYRTAARLEPTNAGVQVGLARALAQAGDRQGAVHAYQMAITLEPGRQDARQELARVQGGAAHPPPPPQQQPAPRRAPPPEDPAVAIRDQARAHFTARRFPQAAAAYAQLTQMRPSDAAAWAGLGACQLAQRDGASAVQSYRRALTIEPRRASFHAALGAAEATTGNDDGARAAFQQALAIEPNNAAARDGLARVGPPRPTLPNTPDRADIVRGMGRFQDRLEACAPELSGTVRFRVVIRGSDGNVQDVELIGPQAGTHEGECMVTNLRGARFPRFIQETLEIVYPFELEGTPAEAPEGGASEDAPAEEAASE